MNTQTGDIVTVFDEKTMAANFGKSLTLQERLELGQVDNTQERLRRYKQLHADDICQQCSQALRDHSLREWQHCEAKNSHAALLDQIPQRSREWPTKESK